VGLGAHPADHAGLQAGPVIGRTRGGRLPQRVTEKTHLPDLGGTPGTACGVGLNVDEIAHGQLAIVER
jgi:hypothetical protein